VRFPSLILLTAIAWPVVVALGQEPEGGGGGGGGPQLLSAQVTVIGQHLFPFSALYSGPKSLDTAGDTKATHTYGAYFGARLMAHLQAHVDIEMAGGAGISQANGVGGVTRAT
jgi:hypothetical protein